MDGFVGGGPTGTEGVPEIGGGRRKTTTAAVVLLLLLLISVGSVLYQSLTGGPARKAIFLATNAKCLVCHSEMAALVDRSSVHYPFEQEQCTSCHTTHGQVFEKRAGAGETAAESFRRACGPFIPIAALQGLLDRIFGTTTTKKWQTTSESRASLKKESLTFKSRKVSKLVNTELKLCMICHGNLGGLWRNRYRHPPFIEGHCTNCHNPHASNYKPLLNAGPRELCVTCHPIAAELKMAQVHPPFEVQDCLSCHSPHASNEKILLRGPQKVVCLACHPTVAPYTQYAVQHSPFAKGDCTGCHEPHAAQVKPLLPESQPTFCYKCHPEIANSFARASHHPVGTLIECSSCHQPHAWHYSYLLLSQGNEMCFTCHPDKRFPYAGTPHNRVEYTSFAGSCVNCHEAHGSDYGPLLADEELRLCWTCHPAYEGPTNHPYFRQTSFPRAGGRVTCSHSCHNPHGTEYRNMLQDLPDGLCLGCHPADELP